MEESIGTNLKSTGKEKDLFGEGRLAYKNLSPAVESNNRKYCFTINFVPHAGCYCCSSSSSLSGLEGEKPVEKPLSKPNGTHTQDNSVQIL